MVYDLLIIGGGRVIFVIPYESAFSLIGTTDLPSNKDAGAVTISALETSYLCEAAARSMRCRVTSDDVVWSYSGVRPPHDAGAENASAVTGDYMLELDLPAGTAERLQAVPA